MFVFLLSGLFVFLLRSKFRALWYLSYVVCAVLLVLGHF